MRLPRRLLLLPLITVSAACGKAVSEDAPAEPPPAAVCDVVTEEDVADVAPWHADIAVGEEGSVFVVYDDDVLRVARRDPGGAWSPADASIQDLPHTLIAAAGGGRAAPAIHLIGEPVDAPSSVLQWNGTSFDVRLQTVSDQVQNQNDRPLAIAPDGTLHFVFTQGDVVLNHNVTVDLFELAPSASEPVLRGSIDGRDPALAVDAQGLRHVLYARSTDDDRRLLYLSPSGSIEEVLPERSAWPALAVTDELVVVLAEYDDLQWIVTKEPGGSFARHLAGEQAAKTCPYYSMFDTTRKGERCDHLVHRLGRSALAGGPRPILIAEEIHEEGTMEWTCPAAHPDSGCFWTRMDGFIETHTLVAGVPTAGGVALSPIPVKLPEDLYYAWHLAVDQDTQGGVHLLLALPDAPSGTMSKLRYVKLTCDDSSTHEES